MINYFARPERPTPLNLAVARVVVASLMLWKLVQYEWGEMTEWPVPLVDSTALFRPDWVVAAMPALAAIAGVALVGVLVGYRLRVSSFVAAFLLTLLSTVRFSYNVSHSSDLVWLVALILLVFGLYAEEDVLTVDELRRTGDRSLSALTDRLESENRGLYPVSALKWSLLLVAILYFQAGLWKLLIDPVAWIQPANLGRYVLFSTVSLDLTMPVGQFLLDHPLLISAAAVGTIVLEFGFLPVLLAKRRIDVFVVGLVGMHAAIAFSVGPVFTDLVVVLLAFAPWDRLQRWLQPDETLRVVYDEQCYFCARSLSLFPYLDANGSVEFYSQRTAPDSLLDRDADFENAMFAFRGRSEPERPSAVRSYRGYHAFRAILRHLGLFAPLSWVMALPVVSDAGERIYAYVAANRSRIATCSIDDRREMEGQRDESLEDD